MIRTILIAAVFSVSAAHAEARVKLQDDTVIESGLRVVSIGKMLYKGCADISPRRIKAFSFARSLQSRARALGYSDAEIDAYLDSDTDKARIKGHAKRYLEARGVDFQKPETLCKVGKSEIAEATSVGKFLRTK